MLKKLLAGVSALALSLGMIALVAAPASAHTGTLSVSAVCQDGGTYLVTYSGATTNVPATGPGHTATLTVGEIQPVGATAVGAPATVVGNTTFGWTETVPGSTTYVQSTAFLAWGDDAQSDPQGTKHLDGTCADTSDSKMITYCHYDGSNDNGGSGKYSSHTTSLWPFYHAGHIDHVNDIFPAGSVVKKGVTYSWNAQGDQSLLQYPNCAIPMDATASISITAPGCDANSAASVVGANFVPVTLDQTVGPHDVTVFATSGHTFADGTTSVVLHYEIVAGPVTQHTDPKAPCFAAIPVVATPGHSEASCVVDQPGVITSGSYTIPTTAGITWTVTVDGLSASSAAGSHNVGPSAHIVIDAAAQTGYSLSGQTHFDWTLTGPSNDCLVNAIPVDPGHTDQICTVDEHDHGSFTSGTIILPDTVGVRYAIDGTVPDPATGTPVAGGTAYDVIPGKHFVSATALTGYTLDASYTGPFPVTIAAALACGDLVDHPFVTPIVTSVQMSCSAGGSYTLSNNLDAANGIIWTVDGSPVAPGTHTVANAQTVTVHAEANGPAYGLDGTQQDWPLHFSAPATCDLKTLALTGSAPVGGIVLGYFLLVAGLGLVAVRAARRRPVREPQE